MQEVRASFVRSKRRGKRQMPVPDPAEAAPNGEAMGQPLAAESPAPGAATPANCADSKLEVKEAEAPLQETIDPRRHQRCGCFKKCWASGVCGIATSLIDVPVA